MTTITDFQRTAQAPFQFQPVMDGTTYNAVITWNLFGQRWYVNLYTLGGVLVFCLPLIGSPPDDDINIAGGYFASTLIYRQQNNQFEVSP